MQTKHVRPMIDENCKFKSYTYNTNFVRTAVIATSMGFSSNMADPLQRSVSQTQPLSLQPTPSTPPMCGPPLMKQLLENLSSVILTV